MSSETLIDELNEMIAHSEKKIAEFKKIKSEIEKLDMYEVGIRKSDNAVFYFEFTLDTFGPSVFSIKATRMPPGNSQILMLSIVDFQRDFVQYSNKARAILPKRL